MDQDKKTTANKRFMKKALLLEQFEKIKELSIHQDPKLADIVKVFGHHGHYLLILFLILPFLQPIPMLGLSTPFGLFIGFVAFLAYLKRPPVIPKTWAKKTIPAKTVLQIVNACEKIFLKVSALIHPRWQLYLAGPFRLLNVFIILFHALLLALPLPIPFSNAIPAWVILFQALAQLEEDGLLIVLSYLLAILSCFYFSAIIWGILLGIESFGAHLNLFAA